MFRLRRGAPALLPILCALPLALAACGDGGGGGATAASGSASKDAAAGKKIYVEQFAKGIRAFTRRAEGLKARAEELGYQVVGIDYANGTPENQISQIENALTKRPDVIVTIPINPDAITPTLRQATQQGAKLVTIGSSVADRDRNLVLTHFSYEPEKLGHIKAAFIAKKLGGKGTVGVVHGIRGHQFAEGQKTGLEAEFAKYPGIKLVDGGYTDFTPETALKATENLLQRGKLDAIYYDADDSAVGGIQAIKQRGIKTSDIVTVGSDLTPAGVDLIKKGDLTFTTGSCTYNAGVEIANTLDRYFRHGVKPARDIPVRQIPVTKANVDDVLNQPKEQCGP